MTSLLTRRAFVGATVALGASAAIGGLSAHARAGGAGEEPVVTPSWRFAGGDGMTRRILVGYATRTGSTVGVAQAIGRVLGTRGFGVDVQPLREGPRLDGYDAVVLGSAVNGGAWLPEAVGFVRDRQDALVRVPVALFCVHIMNLGEDEKARKRRLAYLDPVRALVRPVDEAFFAGVGPDARNTSLIARWAFRAFGGGGEGDLRNWDAIRAWAEAVHA